MKASKFIFSPNDQKNVTTSSTSTPQSTNKIILDYLLFLSIQSRLKQARVELLELSTPLPQSKEDNSTVEIRKQRWEDTASKAEQDKNAVESIVAGILSSHCNRTPSFRIDSNFEQRLHLCQLTNLVFGRFDALSTGQHVIAHSSARRRRHETQMAVVIETDIHDEPCDIKRRQRIFEQPILPPFCRRHRIQSCYGCRSPYLKDKPTNAMLMNKLHKLEEEHHDDNEETQQSFKTLDLANISPPTPPAGLIEAIPTFLRTSADMLRRALESNEDGDDASTVKPMMFAGQKVMGGGMPPRWYDLFLELLTQAAIESYLCDTQAGLEPIFEIFSYGDVEDEEHEDEEDSDDDDDDEPNEQEIDEWGIRAADHHLLFPKTRTMHLFKTQVREREKDFLVVDGVDLQTHFEKLAQTFPLQTFEKSMGDFIQMILDSMDIPALDKYEQSINNAENDNAEQQSAGPSVYKYPGDGSLLMPEIPDDEERHQPANTKKRSASISEQQQEEEAPPNKRNK
ncbi:hypothetical protein INT46_000901 [Mucor plumbeus]|uniref:Uncharacterized protein n=1 Tax=Mucor plumbeus TaxID=97098 RepID=A0A8H7UR07_9FUNG|nr:hypothetical protein INT46_000901 [Mucor plumbeus]